MNRCQVRSMFGNRCTNRVDHGNTCDTHKKMDNTASDIYIIFGISNCPICRHAKSIMESGKINGEYHDISNSRSSVVQELKALGHVRKSYGTVPLVFKNGEFIGGRDELVQVM